MKEQQKQFLDENISIKKQNWLNLLLDNGGNLEEFKVINNNSKNLLFALCKYKKILRQRGQGHVSFIEIEKYYNNNDIKSLHNAINRLFLEYYTEEEIESFLELMKKTNTSLENVYIRHMENPENNIFLMLTL